MSKQPLVKPMRRPRARQRFSVRGPSPPWLAILASIGARCAASSASISSSGEAVAVPAFSTATLEASRASSIASFRSAPACQRGPQRRQRRVPGPRGIEHLRRRTAEMPHRTRRARPGSCPWPNGSPGWRRSSLIVQRLGQRDLDLHIGVPVGRSVAKASSAAFGLTMSAGAVAAKASSPWNRRSASAPSAFAAARQASMTAGVTTPLP